MNVRLIALKVVGSVVNMVEGGTLWDERCAVSSDCSSLNVECLFE